MPDEPGNPSSTIGFGLGLALALAEGASMIWLRRSSLDGAWSQLDGAGLMAFGARPEQVLVAALRRTEDVLQATLEATRCLGVRAVLVELRDAGATVDFTATRRLTLAAKASGATVVLVRQAPCLEPTAAATRWGVAAAPSTPLAAGAPGHPAFRVTLLRHRGGIPGATLRVEWRRDQQAFVAAPLPGAVVPVPALRAAGARARRPAS